MTIKNLFFWRICTSYYCRFSKLTPCEPPFIETDKYSRLEPALVKWTWLHRWWCWKQHTLYVDDKFEMSMKSWNVFATKILSSTPHVKNVIKILILNQHWVTNITFSLLVHCLSINSVTRDTAQQWSRQGTLRHQL